MTTVALQHIRRVVVWSLLAGQAVTVLAIHVWLVMSPDIQSMSLLGSAFVQQSLTVNIMLLVGVPIASALMAIRRTYRLRVRLTSPVMAYPGDRHGRTQPI